MWTVVTLMRMELIEGMGVAHCPKENVRSIHNRN